MLEEKIDEIKEFYKKAYHIVMAKSNSKITKVNTI